MHIKELVDGVFGTFWTIYIFFFIRHIIAEDRGMVLQEAYRSVIVHKELIPRADPGALPPAGQKAAGSSASPRRTLVESKPNNRMRVVQPDVELAVPGASAHAGFSSTTRTSFTQQSVQSKPKKYDFSVKVDPARVGGLGRSVAGVDPTSDWSTTKSATIDDKNATFRSGSLIETRNRSLASSKGLEDWKSQSRSTYGTGCLAAVRTSSPQRRKSGASSLTLA